MMFDDVYDELLCTKKILEQRNKDVKELRSKIVDSDSKIAELVTAIGIYLKDEGDYELIKADKMMYEALVKVRES